MAPSRSKAAARERYKKRQIKPSNFKKKDVSSVVSKTVESLDESSSELSSEIDKKNTNKSVEDVKERKSAKLVKMSFVNARIALKQKKDKLQQNRTRKSQWMKELRKSVADKHGLNKSPSQSTVQNDLSEVEKIADIMVYKTSSILCGTTPDQNEQHVEASVSTEPYSVNILEPSCTTPKRIPPPRRTVSPSKASTRTIRRRKNKISKVIRESLGTNAKIQLNRPFENLAKIDARSAVHMAAKTKMAMSCYRELRSKKLVPSTYKLHKAKKAILEELPFKEHITVSDGNRTTDGIYVSIIAALKHYLQKESVMKHLHGRRLRITVVGDSGGDGDNVSTKIGFFFNDLPIPASETKIIILAAYFGQDSRIYMKSILERLNDELLTLKKDGIETSNGNMEVDLFAVMDLKFHASHLGLQGSSATHCCCWCLITQKDLSTFGNYMLRNMDNMVENASLLEDQLNNAKSDSAKAKIKKQLGSINGLPLLTAIPLENLVPPPLHILMGILKTLCKFAKDENGILFHELLRASGISVKFPSQEFTGRDGTEFLRYICSNGSSDFPLLNLFKLLNEMLLYSKARDYSHIEIIKFKEIIETFYDEYRKQLPYSKLIIKQHVLEKHVIPFMLLHGSWSKFTEQGLEALHKVMNQAIAKIPKRRQGGNEIRWLTYFIQQQQIRNEEAFNNL